MTWPRPHYKIVVTDFLIFINQFGKVFSIIFFLQIPDYKKKLANQATILVCFKFKI